MKVIFITLADAIRGVPGIPQDFMYNALLIHLDCYARSKEYTAAYCICAPTYAGPHYTVNAVDMTQNWPYDRAVFEPCLINIALAPKAFALNMIVLARAGNAGIFNAMYLLTGEVVRGKALVGHLGALMELPQTQAGWDNFIAQQIGYRDVIEVLSKL